MESPATAPPTADRLHFARARRDDTGALYELYAKVMRPRIVAARESWNESRQRYRFIESLDIDHCSIVELDGVRVGFIDCRQIGPAMVIHTLVVAPEHQRRGIGSSVLNAAIAEADRLGVPTIVDVRKTDSSARRLCESLGFVAVHETALHRQLRRPPRA